MGNKEVAGSVQLARALRITSSALYSRLAKHKVSPKGMNLAQLIEAATKAGMDIPQAVRSKLPLGSGSGGARTWSSRERVLSGLNHRAKKVNGHVEPHRLDLADRLRVLLQGLFPLVQRARARIANGTETDDDLQLIQLQRVAQTGLLSESNSQEGVHDVEEE